MIGLFPDPKTDELLYSACARFQDRMKFPHTDAAVEKLFGGKRRAAVDFPTRINHLTSVMPPNHQYTSDILIDRHTLYPYFAPFLPLERALLVRQEMCETGNNIHERLGVTPGRLTFPEVLRFCPKCIKEEQEAGREPYWRRLHQLPGVEVCPTHLVFLEGSGLVRNRRGGSTFFASASRVVTQVRPRPLSKSAPLDAIRLQIANTSSWLLNWHGPYFGSEVLSKRYYHLLLREGYAYYNGRIRNGKFLKAFVDFFTPAFLESLSCPLGTRITSWPLLLLHSSQSTVVRPPLHHILLLTFLGLSPEEVFTRFEEVKPFGEGPWPCLNPVADHFRQQVITECRVSDSPSKTRRGLPKADFHCSCGFTYTRTGTDLTEEDCYRFDAVIAYGTLWRDTFIKQWRVTSLTLEQMANNFRTTQSTLTRNAARLGLPISRVNCGSAPTGEDTDRRYSFESARSEYREKWLSMRASAPEAGRQELQSMAYYTWWWLSKNDAEWLKEHMPASRKTPPRANQNDWENIDRELSTLVKASVQRIKSKEGRPVRASLSAIIKDVGRQSWLESYLHKLPLTAKVVTEDLESYEDHLIRRLHWAAGCFRDEGIIPTRIKLLRSAGEHRRIVESQKVQECIDAILNSFRPESIVSR